MKTGKNFIDKNFGMLALVIILLASIAIGIYWLSTQKDIGIKNMLSINLTVQNPGSSQAPVQTVYKTNLCTAFGPLIQDIATFYGVHPATACMVGGGDWKCDENHVGCYGYDAKPVICTNQMYIQMMTQCSAYGAQGICNPTGVYCQYS